ncbi:MAG TPA: PfkB family carbohydrate kinase, partial [Acidimicrobiales bacterium]|nr:PfkB family carbohydrate kinase [Acidimicrobiales bacterium]
DPVDPAALPDAWRGARAWMIAPVAAEIPDAWAEIPTAGARVALGWQGLLRVLKQGARVHHRQPFSSPVVRRADLVGVGVDDVDDTTAPADLTRLLHPGAEMLLTDGVHGGHAYRVGERGDVASSRHWHSIPIRAYVDPVGAGDSFLSGVFAAQVEPSLVTGWTSGDADLRLGAACGSLILEGPGLFAVPHLEDAIARMSGGDNPD